jgi:DNA-binding LytR/AlgR family response regulator
MARVKIGIVEDEAIIAMGLASILERCDYQIAFISDSYEDAVEALQTNKPDLVLIDIFLSGVQSGIDLAQYINEHEKGTAFAFLTANADAVTVQQAKKTRPAAYLIKPFSDETVYAAIEVALYNNQELTAATQALEPTSALSVAETVQSIPIKQFKDQLFLKQGNAFYKVGYDDILYVESEDVYVRIHTAERRYMLRTPLSGIQDYLHSEHFIRIHKRFIINVRHIHSVTGEYVVIHDQKIPIGRTYKADFISQLPLM